MMKIVLYALVLTAFFTPSTGSAGADNTEIVDDKTAADFAGHYYLSGIMEVGSELLLRPDGTYAWFLAYGSEDQHSKGTWARVGSEIVLTATAQDKDKAKDKIAFSLGEIEPWNKRFEQSVQDDLFEATNIAIRNRCAFLQDRDLPDSGPVTPISNLDYDNYDVVTKQEMAAFAKAKADEVIARKSYEDAAAQAIHFTTGAGAKYSSVGPDIYQDIARSRRLAWREAQSKLGDARGMAKQPFEKRPEAQLLAECTLLTEAAEANRIDPSKWTKAVGVFITDTDTGSPLNTIKVIYHFADGTMMERVTENRGRTWVPMKDGAVITAIELKLDHEGVVYDRKFSVSPLNTGVIPVVLPVSKLLSPTFEEMRLKIEGKTLVGFEGRGRYDRSDN